MLRKLLFLTIFSLQFSFAFMFSIDRPSFHVVTERGSVQNYSLVLKNSNDSPLTVKAYVQDWIYAENKKGKVFLKPGSVKNSCAAWIKFEPAEFVIEPKTKKEFSFRLETPRTAEGGNQAVIFFETQPEAKGKSLNYGARIGSIIYQETKDQTISKIELITKQASQKNGKPVFQIGVKNSGNAWNSAAAIVSLVRSGEVVEQKTFSAVNLLPGDSTDFSGEFSNSGSEILITIEDAKDDLLTDRLVLSAETIIVAQKELQETLTLQSFEAVYAKATKELNISLIVLSPEAKKILPEIKVLKSLPGKNTYERLKTLPFTEAELTAGEPKTINLTWPAGKFLNPGKYILKLTIPDIESTIIREKEIII